MAKSIIFLIVGLSLGLMTGAVLFRTDDSAEPAPGPSSGESGVTRPVEEPDDPKPSTPPPADAADAPLQEEVRALRLQVTELEGELEEARKSLAASGGEDAPGEEEPAAADYEGEFAELLKGGLAAFANPDFQKLAERLAEEGPEAYAFLYDLLSGSEDATTRFLAAAALEKIDDPAAIPALTEVLVGDQDLIVRRMASHAIALIGTDGALEPLRAAMKADADWGVRVNSAYGIAKAGGEDGLKYLEDAYLSEDTPDEYLLGILGGIADVANPSSAPLFHKILADTKDPAYLFIAIAALKSMKDTAAVPHLERIVASDLPESIRSAASEAIEEMKKSSD